jgi:hypothetical protein
MKPEDNDNIIKPDLHDGNWEVKIAEVRLRGNSLLNTWYPLLASILSHVGQTSALTARSAKMAGDSDMVREHMNIARLMAALRTTLKLMHDGGADYASKQMSRVQKGEVSDPSDLAVADWIKTAGELPPKHMPMMDRKVLLAMRVEEMEDSVRLHFDETLCGKNLHHPDDHDAQQAVKEEMDKQERKMGITNNVPPLLPEGHDHGDEDDDEDGTTTMTTDHGSFREVRKIRDRKPSDSDKPKKPAKGDKPSLNDFLDEMLSRKQAEADKRAEQRKKDDGKEYRGRDQIGDDDEPPLPPSRFN